MPCHLTRRGLLAGILASGAAILASMCVLVPAVMAEELEGAVRDAATGEPAAFVMVKLDGQTTFTDEEGHF